MNQVRITFVGILCIALSCCGGNGGVKPDAGRSCAKVSSFKGNRLDHSVDISNLNSQPLIDRAQRFSETDESYLNATLASIINETRMTDMTITLAIPGKGTWTQTRIVSQPFAANVKPDEAVFWWMSIGKAYTAVVIQQLVDEGKLTLGDTIDKWFPNIPFANLITIDHLLTHTSGIYSFQEDPEFRQQAGYFSPDKLIEVALSHAAMFCPGENWYYSNSGYVLLGLIIQQIENRDYAQVIQDRIASPLNLSKTRALQPDELPSQLILTTTSQEDIVAQDKVAENKVEIAPSVPFSAGNIISTSEDMVIFLQALLIGKLYSVPLLEAAITKPYQMFGSELYYGKGLITYYRNDADIHIDWLGHSGGVTTKNALIAYDLDSGAYIAISVNDKTPASAIAVRFFAAAQKIKSAL